MNKYKLKKSGIEWIGDIPEDWNIIRFKDKYVNKKEIAKEKANQYERLALTLNGVVKRSKDDMEGLQPKEFDGYQILRENEFIFKMIDLQNISTSRVGLSEYEGLVSPAYIKFSPKEENQYNKYVYYYLMSLYYNCVFNNLGGNGVRSALNAYDMGQFKIPFPSLSQQKIIVKELEEKLDKVNKLLNNQLEQIEKLKQYKQSLITEVVTKGLDSNIEMKDSGVDWVGEMPYNWRTVQLSSLVKERKNKNAKLQVTNLLSLSYGNVIRKNINTTDGLLPKSFDGYNIVEENDIVLRLTDLQNDHTSLRTGLVKEKGIITSAYVTINVIADIMVPAYLHKVLHSYDIKKGFYGMGAGVRQGLNYQGVKKIIIPCPHYDEQLKIVSYLNEKENQINQLVQIKQNKLNKLNEYKKSLIYEYVTGKKEVTC